MVRVKHRYLLVNFLYPEPSKPVSAKEPLPEFIHFHQPTPDQLNPGVFIRAIRDGVGELFGDYGAGMVSTSLKINYFSTATSTAIIRCPRDHYQLVWAALTYMTRLPKPVYTPVVVRVVRVSGTIKKAEEEAIRRAKEIIERAKRGDMRCGPVGDIVKAARRAGNTDVGIGQKTRKEEDVLAVVDEGGSSGSG